MWNRSEPRHADPCHIAIPDLGKEDAPLEKCFLSMM